MFDKKQFKVAVMLAGLTLRQVAAALNIDEATLYRKMNGESDFYRREIQQLCSILKIENPSAIFSPKNLRKRKNREQKCKNLNFLEARIRAGLPSER